MAVITRLPAIAATIIIVCMIEIAANRASDPKPWDDDVYTGSQLNALLLSTTSLDHVVKYPGVLIMYGPDCYMQAMAFKTDLIPWGPKDVFLQTFTHDYVTFRNHIWYELNNEDDLMKRYWSNDGKRYHKCLKILYFGNGYQLTNPDVYDFTMPFYDWVWSKMETTITILNAQDKIIHVYREGQGKPHLLGTLPAYKQIEANIHIGMHLTAYDEDLHLIYYKLIDQKAQYELIKLTKAVLSAFNKSHDLGDSWSGEDKERIEEESAVVKKWSYDLAVNYLLTFKQPVLVPRFTENGYKVMKIPPNVYKIIKDFYMASQDQRVPEGNVVEPMINGKDVQTTMIHLSQEVKTSVYDLLLEEMERWCNCKLEGTSFYGVREYYKGSILRNHVDRVEELVISSILVIHKDLGANGIDWDLEVIQFDGKKSHVTLQEGEMLLYESATLIHGRPKPYLGKIYANCFLHYRPKDSWPWRRAMDGEIEEESHLVLTDGKIKEAIDFINTPATNRLNRHKDHKVDYSIKSEL